MVQRFFYGFIHSTETATVKIFVFNKKSFLKSTVKLKIVNVTFQFLATNRLLKNFRYRKSCTKKSFKFRKSRVKSWLSLYQLNSNLLTSFLRYLIFFFEYNNYKILTWSVKLFCLTTNKPSSPSIFSISWSTYFKCMAISTLRYYEITLSCVLLCVASILTVTCFYELMYSLHYAIMKQ